MDSIRGRKKLSKYKKQHYVPKGYLKAWCDPSAPKQYTPYVWIFSKDGNIVKKRSPKNLFHEKDFYTIKRADGKRDLTLEHGLSELEDQFCALRDKKLRFRQNIGPEEHIILCAFIAATSQRTKIMQVHQQKQWQEALGMMDKMREWAKTATSEEKKAMAGLPGSGEQKRQSLSYDEVKKLAEEPIQHMLLPSISIETPLLCKIDFAILETDTQPGFITSDNPCVWSDPEAYKRPPFYRGPGLIYESVEITLPISPQQAILLNRKGFNGYITVNENAVDM
ncbi:MAG: DUF4238 domain-containing protein, partial [Candidatus Aminicenantes bacterium]|nr:DUF4238 domain-containing protein [Candidatus Aminicenantes bacterium]